MRSPAYPLLCKTAHRGGRVEDLGNWVECSVFPPYFSFRRNKGTFSTHVLQCSHSARPRSGQLEGTAARQRFGCHQRTSGCADASDRCGGLQKVGRGLYRLPNAQLSEFESLGTIATKVPQAVFCLLTALQFHELTTQLPRQIWIAMPRGSHPPRIDYPPVKMVQFTGEVIIAGDLARARCKTQIDVGFGDAVTPAPVDSAYPVLLEEMPAPRLRA